MFFQQCLESTGNFSTANAPFRQHFPVKVPDAHAYKIDVFVDGYPGDVTCIAITAVQAGEGRIAPLRAGGWSDGGFVGMHMAVFPNPEIIQLHGIDGMGGCTQIGKHDIFPVCPVYILILTIACNVILCHGANFLAINDQIHRIGAIFPNPIFQAENMGCGHITIQNDAIIIPGAVIFAKREQPCCRIPEQIGQSAGGAFQR